MSGSTSLEAPPASPAEIVNMLERLRSNHEKIERLEQMVMEDLKTEETSPMEQLLQGHRLRSLARSIVLKTETLVETYEKNGAVIDDIASPRDQSRNWTNVSSAFSSRLQEILEYHRTHTCAPLVDYEALDYEALSKEEPVTGDECFDPYLDLHDISSESESGDGPLKRSMGWDGKPIPYWLDKLGLGQEYKCEICDNDSYAGKKAFERHFKEWRHKAGLRSLGIPYTETLIGIASIEEAEEIGMTKRPRLPRPLVDRSQLMDQGTKGSCSNQAPVGVAVPPPDIRNVVGKTVGILSETRLEIERKIIDVFGKVAGFEFLNSGDEYHAFYLQSLAERRAGATSVSDGVGAATRSGHGDSQTCLTAEFTVPLPNLEPHKFTCRVPEGITGKELDIIKLTAQFWALYGSSFWEEHCSESRNNDPEFEFMKKRGGGRFGLFSRLVQGYAQVVAYSHPGFFKVKLRENPTSDMETVLENCFHRLQMDRFSKERWEERAREERAREEKGAKWVPRGAQLLVHMCEMGRMARDPPPKPDPKRQMIDESELVSEDEFLAQQPPGCAKIWIYLPCDSGGEHFKIKMPSLSEKVASLKEKIVQWVGVPVTKQKLSGKVGILEDNKSLAHYNVGAQDVLTLIVEWRKLPVR